jgi:hypothetical protein
MITPSSLRGRGGSLKKARRPNLTVTFAVVPDIIMGVGGEECDEPPMVISGNRRASQLSQSGSMRRKPVAPDPIPEEESTRARQAQTPPPAARPESRDGVGMHPGYGPPQKSLNDGAVDAYRKLFGEEPQPPPADAGADDDDFVPKRLKRAPTGFQRSQQLPGRDSLSSLYSEDDGSGGPSPVTSKGPTLPNVYKLPELDSVFDNSPIDFNSGLGKPFRPNPNAAEGRSPVELHDKIQKMRQEEGRVLHQLARRSIIDLAGENIGPSQLQSQSQSQPQTYTSSDDIYDPYNAYAPKQPRQISPEKQRNLASLDREPRLPVMPLTYPAPSTVASTPSPQSTSMSVRESPQQTLPIRKAPGTVPIPAASQMPKPALASKPTPTPLTIPKKDYFSNEPLTASVPQSGVSHRSNLSQYSQFSTPPTATSIKTPATSFMTPATSFTTSATSFMTPATSATSTTTPATATSKAAYDEFAERCAHMKGIFRLQAEFERPMSDYTPSQWLRAAAWWLLKGRIEMELLIRGRPKSADGQTPGGAKPQELLKQPHVDLAKTLWILSDVLPSHRSLPPAALDASYATRAMAAISANDAMATEVFEGCEVLQSNLRGLLSSMNKNNAMPPHNALIQGQDQTIWVPYMDLAPELLPLLSGSTTKSLTERAAPRHFDPLTVMGVADTKVDFVYYRWFVKVSLGTADSQEEPIQLLAVLSVMRTRNEWHPKVAICTQKELLTICVTGERKYGPSWEDVKWSEQDTSLQIRLAHGYVLNAQLMPADYRIVVGMYRKAFTVQTSLFPMDDEHVAFEGQLADFQYSDTLRPPVFPLERMRRCRVRLLIKSEVVGEGAGARRFYRGMRIMVTTSPKNRNLASVSHELVAGEPVIMELFNETTPGGDGFPAMRIFIDEDHRKTSFLMIFAQAKDRQLLYGALNQAEMESEEMPYASLRLKKLSIEPIPDIEMKGPHNPLGRMQWQDITVINGDPQNPDDDFGQVVLSSSLRIVATSTSGMVTDRMNLDQGELRLKISPDGTPNVMMLRQAQEDMTITMDCRTAPFTPEQIAELQEAIATVATRRTFTFFNGSDLHSFLFAITGFKVKFDGLARAFTVSRRRPVTALSKHRRLEAALTRVMVVSHDNDRVVQLLAFFESDVSWAESIGFVLKGTDTFELYEGGKHAGAARCGVRFVDAKFSLPKEKSKKKGMDDIERPYVCLDTPDYPGENDDVWIGFDDTEGEFCVLSIPVVKKLVCCCRIY